MKRSILSVFLSFIFAGVYAQTDSSILVFQHANVIDGISRSPLLNATVIVAYGKIASIKRYAVKIPAQAIVMDCKGKWLLPGYIDAHVHFSDVGAAKTALLLGSTTVRTMHCDTFLDIHIRDDHRKGQRDLPDVIAAGYQVRPDMFEAFPSFIKEFPDLADMQPRISGTENVRRVVRALVSRGVNHIKFLATERSGTLA